MSSRPSAVTDAALAHIVERTTADYGQCAVPFLAEMR